MINYIRKYQQQIFLIGIIGLLILSRFANINQSARFIWDESDDLVRMFKIFQEKKITLVGPINTNDNTILFGSLSYYMLLPITILFGFDPIGPVAATAVYSIILILILSLVFTKKYHYRFTPVVLFFTFIFPLVQAGRWAWNPHLVLFWQGLALSVFLIFYKKNNWYYWWLIGFFLGLAIHNHWYAFFPLVGFGLSLLLIVFKEKKIKKLVYFFLGVGLSVFPFILFDIRHPPGLFLTRFIYFGPFSSQKVSLKIFDLIKRATVLPLNFFNYFFQNQLISLVFLTAFIIYLIMIFSLSKDFLKKIIFIPVATHLLGLLFINPVYNHYFLPAVIFFLGFLLIPDKDKRLVTWQKIIIIAFFLLNIIPSFKEIKKDNWETNIGTTRKIVKIIADNLPKNIKCNLYVPASPSADIFGKRYRDLLFTKNIHLMGKEDFRDYQCLFVISTSRLPAIKKDPAYELDLIRDKKPNSIWQVKNSPWIIYLFKL